MLGNAIVASKKASLGVVGTLATHAPEREKALSMAENERDVPLRPILAAASCLRQEYAEKVPSRSNNRRAERVPLRVLSRDHQAS